MSPKMGIIALMGSGELTATMVEVHKRLLSGLSRPLRGVFLDTPAGFQLNVDEISLKAAEYFRTRVQQSIAIASYKSGEASTPFESEKTFQTLRDANFTLIGPGSPTYAVRQWRQTPIPEILTQQIEAGGCLVAASAAALTVGRLTLPVYEIYKVGEPPHWVDGLNILAHFGLDLVVIPHWNNAEGGTHDTRFCYMGEPRFRRLESLLPEDVAVFGLDEHTACLMDLEKGEATIKGIGSATLRRQGTEVKFKTGVSFSLDVFREKSLGEAWTPATEEFSPREASGLTEASFWERVHGIESAFYLGLDKHEPKAAASALLELDRTIWEAKEGLESTEFISQARDMLREFVVSLGIKLESTPEDAAQCLAPLVEEMLEVREHFRKQGQWDEADAIREGLRRSKILVEDTPKGPRWRFVE
jgi:peptidase E